MKPAPKKKRVRKKRDPMGNPKASPEFAAKACAHVAGHLSEHMEQLVPADDGDYWEPSYGLRPDYELFHFAHAVLLEVAAGRDPAKLIDHRKLTDSPRKRAVEFMSTAMCDGSCKSMNEVYRAAAEKFGGANGGNERNMKRYWSEYVARLGIDPIPSWAPSSNPPGDTRHPAATFVDWMTARRKRKERALGSGSHKAK